MIETGRLCGEIGSLGGNGKSSEDLIDIGRKHGADNGKEHRRHASQISSEVRAERCKDKWDTPGPAVLNLPESKPFDCAGCQDFNCLDKISILSFFGICNLKCSKWILSHKLSSIECNHHGCSGTCQLVTYDKGTKLALRCSKCKYWSKGSNRGMFRMGKLDQVKMLLIYYAIAKGLPFEFVKEILPTLGKNTWTRYVKVFDHLFLSSIITILSIWFSF